MAKELVSRERLFLFSCRVARPGLTPAADVWSLISSQVVMTITTVLLFLFTLAMISKLSVATKILKVATQAVMVRPAPPRSNQT